MPIYEFQCEKCQKEFEVLTIGMNEKATPVCPKCKSKKTRRMMSAFGRGRYTSLLSGGTASPSAPSGSSCSSCSSSNCSSCGH